jgi:hypothetical protein
MCHSSPFGECDALRISSQALPVVPALDPKYNKIEPTAESQAFLDNFTMGNDLKAVEMEQEITK